MCMLCVIQKWSRRVATMLPWLVLPLIGLWALSQLLPPAFRFEITSPRLACVFVLLVTLFWYEVLMPFLSAWRLRRNARLRERKRFEALELQKLKKTATRKCRNCLTPYRDQSPGGGKFMCSYCGHISKRPVLDLPLPPGMVDSRSGVIYDLFGKGGRILNGNSWSDNVSICSQDWMENGSWIVNGSFSVKSGYPLRKSDGFFSGSEPCLVGEKSYSGSLFVACKLLRSCLASIHWLWRKLFGIDSSKDDSSSDSNRRGMLSKKYENTSGPETRGEKARRKAEEKRQARLDKELLEEEERKQREEVAKLVEERRRLRDEKTEAENRAKGTFSLRENNSKKEAEKRRQEKRKEKDKGSSKSNSDVEELDKKVGKDSLKTGLESVKGYVVESGMGLRSSNCSNNCGQGHVGTRYFDRMRGTFLSSSKAFTDRGFKEVKLGANGDCSFVSSGRRDVHTPDRQGKSVMNGDDRSDICPVKTTSMSWQHLFTQSPPAPTPAPASSSSSHSNVISRPITKPQLEIPNPHPPCSMSSPQLYDNPINLPLPFVLPFFSSTVSNTCAETSRDLLPEEPELFEDPCYEPDPVSLLGPVSESLDNFQLDLGNSFRSDELRKPCNNPTNVSSLPIESPILKQNDSIHMYTFPTADVDGMSGKGSWRMWDSSPLGSDGLSWIGPLEWNELNTEDIIHYTPPKTMASLFINDGPKGQQVCPYGSSIPSLNDQDPWLQNTCFSAYSSGESHVTTSPTKEGSQKNEGFDYESKNEWAPHGNGNPAVMKSPPVRGLFSPPDVQSLW